MKAAPVPEDLSDGEDCTCSPWAQYTPTPPAVWTTGAAVFKTGQQES